MISKEEFKSKITTGFAAEKKAYDKQRKISLIYFIASTAIFGSVLALVFVFAADFDNVALIIPLSVFLFFLVCLIPVFVIKTKFLNKFKSEAMPKIFEILLEKQNYSYNHLGYIPQEIFYESNICNRPFNKYRGEDYFSIEFPYSEKKATAFFCISDLNVENETYDSKTNEKDTDYVFNGVFGYIAFEKYFKCRLDLNVKTVGGLKRLSLESVDFEKKFKSYTNDQIESRLILTVTLMDKLFLLAKHAGGKVQLSFQNNKLFMTMKKNLFTIPLNQDTFEFKTVEKIYDDILLIEEISKIIQDNKKIFKA